MVESETEPETFQPLIFSCFCCSPLGWEHMETTFTTLVTIANLNSPFIPE